MLWFRTTLQHSLLNPNQIRAYGHELNDNPWTRNDDFGIECDDQFIPFDTTGMIVHFESRVPTEWEKTHLPVIVMTSDEWNPSEMIMNDAPTREQAEMRTIRSLTSGMTRRQAATARVHESRSHIELNGEVEWEFA